MKLIDTLDNSMRQTFASCPRRFYFEYVENWVCWGKNEAGQSSEPAYFTIGKAFGEYVQARLDNKRHEAALDLALDNWRQEQPEPDATNNETTLIRGAEWTKDLFSYNPLRERFNERGFRLPIGEVDSLDRYYAGAFDSAIRQDSGVQLIEVKFLGTYLSKNVREQYSIARQTLGYQWAGREVWGKEFNGLTYLIVTKKPVKNGVKYAKFEATKPTVNQFADFKASVLWDFESLDRLITDTFWPIATDATNCSGGIYKAPCPFKDICLNDLPWYGEDLRQYNSNFSQREPWEPWKR